MTAADQLQFHKGKGDKGKGRDRDRDQERDHRKVATAFASGNLGNCRDILMLQHEAVNR
ncbi:GM12682 [Drosophila sechellia]|uniref:GM12682 n=1 Tax=Drosophila sechellia TaxID=7238 RepID=B4I0X9_DROSE|nr:GM12682 [Drosophila sechellia]